MSKKRRSKPKESSYACVMSPRQARSIRHAVTIGHKCTSKRHPHFERADVDRYVEAGDMEWFGIHKRIAVWIEHKIWAKTVSGPVTTMQLVEPAVVYARRKR